MELSDKIYVAGAGGLLGSAICRRLTQLGYTRVVAPASSEIDLCDQRATFEFMNRVRPDYVFIAAARVGGIWANSSYPADFCYQNLLIASNVIHGAYQTGVKKLLFPGSTCIYPTNAPIPIKETAILMGPPEQTNEPYAVAKIAGMKLCEYYRRQFGCDFISVVPSNTYGPNDKFDPATSHMVPSLIYKFHLAKMRAEGEMMIWGTGRPRRELIYVDDLADACIFLMQHYSDALPVNIGLGEDYPVKEVAEMIQKVTGFEGRLSFDATKPDGVYQKLSDVSLLKSLGWKPRTSLEEGLRLTYQWFVENFSSLKVHPVYQKRPFFLTSEPRRHYLRSRLLNPRLRNKSLDDPETAQIHQDIITAKPFLKKVYEWHCGEFIRQEKAMGPSPGLSLEIGTGIYFLKPFLPHIETLDLPSLLGRSVRPESYRLPYGEGELRAIYLTGVLHHLGRPREFFREARRCLQPGGILGFIEPHLSYFGEFFFKRLHHAGYDDQTRRWEFPQEGPLSGANTALASLIFDRDRALFQKEFPELAIVSRRYHTFLIYILSGGISLNVSAPGWSFLGALALEKLLSPLMEKYLGTMQTIILKKVTTQPPLLSFPPKRESRKDGLDARLRGHDEPE